MKLTYFLMKSVIGTPVVLKINRFHSYNIETLKIIFNVSSKPVYCFLVTDEVYGSVSN